MSGISSSPDLVTGITDTFLVTDKVALITGGGSGIGQETAIVLAAAGARVIATDIDSAGLDVTRSLAKESGLVIDTRILDVSDPEAVSAAVDNVMVEHGKLDVLVNAAGILITRSALDVTPDELERVLRINLGGTFFACQAAGRAMKADGRIVNLASAIIDTASPGRGTYGISKGGVVQVTRTFALELGPAGIRVNAIAPGWVETGMTRQHWTAPDGTIDEDKRTKYIAKMQGISPMATVGTSRDIAMGVLWLVSGAGSFVTGQVIRINGGAFMA
ncbi:SDR family oxidoreductase [Rhodococcus sp. IEGM 1366]|uniref:SDR family NAD(P)-dependent oxidoreductase n=1 Tax=Rhodococcus sp. IEGM 1366 TaxID=3082223 RepID=UPI002953D44B|nr:SDR family oxidoreductase [Rhodococcus sp. IEGM 1366]MDV8070964.1 SDR family oxidoreductase [Rhodococcus sp. IEGM 1366]